MSPIGGDVGRNMESSRNLNKDFDSEQPSLRCGRRRRFHPKRLHDDFTANGKLSVPHSTMALLSSRKVKSVDITDGALHGLSWEGLLSETKGLTSKQFFLSAGREISEGGICEDFSPMALQANTPGSDTPTWNEAMNGPLADGFHEACLIEMTTLEDKEAWEVVDRTPDMKVLPGT